MLRHPCGLDRRISFTSTIVLPLCLALSACGGGGGSHVASIPPPPPTPAPTPTPTPTPPPPPGAYPITRAGTYDLTGVVVQPPMDARTATPGEFKLTVSQGPGYDFQGPTGFLPGGLTSAHYDSSSFSGMTSPTRGGYSELYSYDAVTNVKTAFIFDAGYSYVSMGEWDWWFVHLDGGTAGGYGQLLFVAGDHTPQSGIPVSGTATYDAHSFKWGTPFTLTADFGQRIISTLIDQDYRYNPNGDMLDEHVQGIHVSGSASFSNSGTFDIPLTGTANWSVYNLPATPASEPVTGTMNGAFFGPHAEQVGGVYSLDRADKTRLTQDAFVGQNRGP